MNETYEIVKYQLSEFGLDVVKDDVWRNVLMMMDAERDVVS